MNPPATQPEPGPTPPPRAFAQGTGLVLQSVGFAMFLLTCCVCSTSFLWDTRPTRDQVLREVGQHGLGDTLHDPAKLGVALTILSANVGGLALAALGLGLQSDRRLAAPGAVAAAGLTLAAQLGAAASLWSGPAPAGIRIANALFLIVLIVLLGFTITAHRQVRREPPPPDIDIVPPGKKIPYSFYHEDPPEVRLARELEQRRAKLDAEKKELDRIQGELDKHDKPPT